MRQKQQGIRNNKLDVIHHWVSATKMWAQVELREKGQLSQIILGVFMSAYTYWICFLLFCGLLIFASLSFGKPDFLCKACLFQRHPLGHLQLRINATLHCHFQWYTGLLICCLCCKFCDCSPNSCHWKMLSNFVSWSFLWITAIYGCAACLDPSFLYFFTAPLPSWHHPHQTPSLGPFITDAVTPQIQVRQGGVL